MIGARVNVVEGWGAELAHEINADVRGAVAQASEVGAKVAAEAAGARHRQDGSGWMKDIKPVETIGTDVGWEGGFKSKAFWSGFQSRGTLGSRKRRVKAATLRRRQTASGQARLAKVAGSKGVTPLRHEEKGLAAAKAHLLDSLNRL